MQEPWYIVNVAINYGIMIDKSKSECHGKFDKFKILQELKRIWVNFSKVWINFIKSIERNLNKPLNRVLQLKPKLLNYPNLKTNNQTLKKDEKVNIN